MITALISILILILGYFVYGKFIANVFRPDASSVTPARSKNDGVDYIVMPNWKVFMIQFLNIAGTGPIFGAILGAKFGPSCYLWIVLGCIFGGAVHDYFTGMLSIRHGGADLPAIIGHHLGKTSKMVATCFSALMLVLVGTVFVFSPAVILGDLVPVGGEQFAVMTWVFIILGYYIIATLLPIDKIIGKIYPVFAFALIFMAISLLVSLIIKWPADMPELWDGLQNRSPVSGSIFPCLFISIACGAISGFHATQSPIMARCLDNEKNGRPIFYGAMITEGIVAVIWAAVSSYFFHGGGNVEMGAESVVAAPAVVNTVSRYWLGALGGVFAVLGVVAAPISSGDTALRSVRLIIASALKLDQKPIGHRLQVALPIFIVTALLLWFNISDANGFDKIWRYFGWANQTLAAFTLWAITAFLLEYRKGAYYLITMLPAAFMTSVCVTFICTAKIGLNMPESIIPYLGVGTFVLSVVLFYVLKNRADRSKAF